MERHRPCPPASLDAMRLAAIRRGEVAEFESLYLDRYTMLVRFASRYLRDLAIAEEIVHDVFLAIWAGRSVWNPATTIDAGELDNGAEEVVRNWLEATPEVSSGIRMLESNLFRGHTPSHNDLLQMTGGSGPDFSYSGNAEWGLMQAAYGRLSMYSLSRGRSPNVAMSGRTRSDLVMSQRMNTWATVTLNVMNVGNDYQSDAGAWWPTLGRQTLMGLALRSRRH